MSTLAQPDGVGPFYVALLARWECKETCVYLTSDLRYSISANPLHVVVRAERYAALHLARPRARLLVRWPLSWCRAQVTAAPERCLMVRDFIATAICRGVVDPAFLAVDERTPETMVVLPRRKGWWDGNRRA